MPSVRIEEEAFGDERYADLATFAGLADADHARGKMLLLWRQCTLEGTHKLGNQMVKRILGPNGIQAVIDARLGELAGDSHVRIRGTKGRIEWLEQLRSNGRKGGRPKRNRTKPDAKPSGLCPEQPDANPLTLTPSPALAPVLNTPSSSKLDRAAEIAEAAVGEINSAAHTRYQADSASVYKLCRALARHKHTPEEAIRVIRFKRDWLQQPDQRKWFRPATLLALANFEKYLDELNATGKPQLRVVAPDEPPELSGLAVAALWPEDGQ